MEEIRLMNYSGINRFKSIKRAIKRGLVSPVGTIFPDRPFNNRGNTSNRKGIHSRVINEYKKLIYGRLKK
jgi:hypothetical protein